MKAFMDDNFLLHSDVAAYLYHEHAARMPVIDYHSHLSPARMAMNANFANLTDAWLSGDHYKWRAMRAHGIEEKFCTGDASDEEKFGKWAETVPYTLRNPLYHWTHLELRRYFGITNLLDPDSADEIFAMATSMLQQDDYRPMALLKKMNVEVVCTTDDPVDNLEHHRKIRKSGAEIKVFPTWRPDKAMACHDTVSYNQYLAQLSSVSGIEISSYDRLLEALQVRHDFFHAHGCRLSDHGLEVFESEGYTDAEVQQAFSQLLAGKTIDKRAASKLRSAILHDLAVMDHEKGWVQQFHVGAVRNNNSRMYESLGPDTGFDSMGDGEMARPMTRFLDRLDQQNRLAKTILYNLNPRDNEVMATMAGNFQEAPVPGKIQWGSAWWFLDQNEGIEKQLNALSSLGLLSHFVGMLTDSRSFLSFPRHEYFRRILCNLVGRDMEKGELPDDRQMLGKMIEDICYYNAKNYFGFK
jgi:glucuronate isomerase